MLVGRSQLYFVSSHNSHRTINAACQPEKITKLVPAFNLDLCPPRTFPTAVKGPTYTRGGLQIVLRTWFWWGSVS